MSFRLSCVPFRSGYSLYVVFSACFLLMLTILDYTCISLSLFMSHFPTGLQALEGWGLWLLDLVAMVYVVPTPFLAHGSTIYIE